MVCSAKKKPRENIKFSSLASQVPAMSVHWLKTLPLFLSATSIHNTTIIKQIELLYKKKVYPYKTRQYLRVKIGMVDSRQPILL